MFVSANVTPTNIDITPTTSNSIEGECIIITPMTIKVNENAYAAYAANRPAILNSFSDVLNNSDGHNGNATNNNPSSN